MVLDAEPSGAGDPDAGSSGAGSSDSGGPAVAELLSDLTDAAFLELSRAARRAFDTVDRSLLPPIMRPFSGWKPERLVGGRARRALIEALAVSPALREATGAAAGSRLWEAAEERAAGTLVERFGAGPSVVALLGRGRWQDATAVDAELGWIEAAQGRTSAEPADAEVDEDAVAGLRTRLAELEEQLRVERDHVREQRRRADAAQQHAASLVEERDRLAGRLGELEGQLGREREERARLKAKQRQRLARRDRRLRAEREGRRVDADRVRQTAVELEGLAGRLREALGPGLQASGSGASTRQSGAEADEAEDTDDTDDRLDGAVPKAAAGSPARWRSPSVLSGRPCVPPKGLSAEAPQAVTALLGVAGLVLFLDGYNVTLDPRGRARAPLPQQREWLTATAAAVSARFGCRVLVVFDGDDDRVTPRASPRGVRVVFTEPDELADDRIVELLELDRERPALVVTSDAELSARCRELGANVVSSGAFLAAVGG